MEHSRSDTADSDGGQAATVEAQPDTRGTSPGVGMGAGWRASVSRWSRRRKVLAGLAAVGVLATVVVVVEFVRGPGPDEVVRDFLTAVQQRDVDEALAIAGADRPTGDQARFLDREALSGDWRIVALETTSEHVRDGRGSAQVSVTIAGPEGFQEGGFDLSWSGSDDSWRIDHPLLTLRLQRTSLWYVDVNGLIGPVAEHSFLVLPGFYRFYGTRSELADIKPMTALLLPQWNLADGGAYRPASVTLTPKGEQVARQLVRTHIDECGARTELAPRGCPFAVSRRVRQPGGDYLTDVASPRWQVLAQPALAFSDQGDGFGITFTAPGTVRLTATGRPVDAPATPVPFAISCRIGSGLRLDWYRAGLSAPDTLTLQKPDRSVATC